MAKPIVDRDYLKDIEKVLRELRALISTKNCAPIILRLYTHGANSGLKMALDFCDQVKSKCPKITYADLYQLAGVVVVEVTGSPTVNFVPGRKDSNISPKEGRLPDARKGFDGPWTAEPLKFDNSYFGENEGLLKLPTDVALLDDPEFRHNVELYAKSIVKDGTVLAQSAFGAAVAATVVIQSYFYEFILYQLGSFYMYIILFLYSICCRYIWVILMSINLLTPPVFVDYLFIYLFATFHIKYHNVYCDSKNRTYRKCIVYRTIRIVSQTNRCETNTPRFFRPSRIFFKSYLHNQTKITYAKYILFKLDSSKFLIVSKTQFLSKKIKLT
ncbi:hypothetical protein ACJIZ3_015287 [Penstemon smallii]|uniref:Plant heme peroxidase family profile domain-containing protein n=1 Tax=Penstemon smallii TaxID=265156 RepID=A0ABD3RMU8_9LAMI